MYDSHVAVEGRLTAHHAIGIHSTETAPSLRQIDVDFRFGSVPGDRRGKDDEKEDEEESQGPTPLKGEVRRKTVDRGGRGPGEGSSCPLIVSVFLCHHGLCLYEYKIQA